jgi:catechol 2,3-dioxygenase-like lactoylglutathione lyase family enzyme
VNVLPGSAAFTAVDHVTIAVRELAAAGVAYGSMLGVAPAWHGVDAADAVEEIIYRLDNCAVRLAAPAAPGTQPAGGLDRLLANRTEGMFEVAFASNDLDASARALRAAGLPAEGPANYVSVASNGETLRSRRLVVPREHARGVRVVAVERAAPLARSMAIARGASAARAVDHVVIFTDDLAAALRLWRDVLGVPERWRREFPNRGTVNVGLRLGRVTIEIVAPLGGAAGERGESLWGIAYAVDESGAAVARLRHDGIAVTDVRSGLAPATKVATVKWPDRVPSLLIEHTTRFAPPSH